MIDPEQIAGSRRAGRAEKHVEQRRVDALELIADTLEAIRLDLAAALNSASEKSRSGSR